MISLEDSAGTAMKRTRYEAAEKLGAHYEGRNYHNYRSQICAINFLFNFMRK